MCMFGNTRARSTKGGSWDGSTACSAPLVRILFVVEPDPPTHQATYRVQMKTVSPALDVAEASITVVKLICSALTTQLLGR
jgi:hypothetical protein